MYSRPGIAYVLNGQLPLEQVISRRESFYREHRFELHELAPRRASLEAAFMELTQGSQEYQGARSAATAVAPGVLAPPRMEN